MEAVAAEARCVREGSVDHETPERHLDRIWARALIRQAIERTGGVYANRGRAHLFAMLRPVLENGDSLRGGPAAGLAAALGLTEGNFRVAMSRLLNCFATRLHEEVALTVADDTDIWAQIAALRDLFSASSRFPVASRVTRHIGYGTGSRR